MPSAVHHGVLLLLRVHHQAAASRALAEQSSAALPLAQPLPETNTVSQLTTTHDWHQGTIDMEFFFFFSEDTGAAAARRRPGHACLDSVVAQRRCACRARARGQHTT